ncbi:hypothetical protein BD289DRAFT_454243 [Coniella lustricola]|uniref:Uncharacterized protein n=1 Tax=Coniella lustricola TaxID=2025994 RepID=A0A2T3A4B7_9PEZI|nr:hypothetical protein BD289DRAFT_454243 [Coniella lustricola]
MSHSLRPGLWRRELLSSPGYVCHKLSWPETLCEWPLGHDGGAYSLNCSLEDIVRRFIFVYIFIFFLLPFCIISAAIIDNAPNQCHKQHIININEFLSTDGVCDSNHCAFTHHGSNIFTTDKSTCQALANRTSSRNSSWSWYRRCCSHHVAHIRYQRRPTKEIGSKAFNPAMDSVSIPRPVAVAAGKRDWFSASSNPTRRDSTTRILDMNDPAAWRESYSAASPRELDGQDKMLSRQFSFIPSGRPSLSTQRGGDEGAVAGGIDATGGFVSPTSTMGFAVNPRTEGSSLITRHNHGSRMLTPVVAERDFPPDSWDIPAPLRVKRKPVPQFAELPG